MYSSGCMCKLKCSSYTAGCYMSKHLHKPVPAPCGRQAHVQAFPGRGTTALHQLGASSARTPALPTPPTRCHPPNRLVPSHTTREPKRPLGRRNHSRLTQRRKNEQVFQPFTLAPPDSKHSLRRLSNEPTTLLRTLASLVTSFHAFLNASLNVSKLSH